MDYMAQVSYPGLPIDAYNAVSTDVYQLPGKQKTPTTITAFGTFMLDKIKVNDPKTNVKVFITPIWAKDGKIIENWSVKLIGYMNNMKAVRREGKSQAKDLGLNIRGTNEAELSIEFLLIPKPGQKLGFSKEMQELSRSKTGIDINKE
jgi:hypothetical protein